MPEPSTIGRRLRAFRERAGMTQLGLSRETGVPRSTIAAVESGVRSGLSVENLIKIADALGVSLDTLVRGDPLQSDLTPALA